jgi:phage/plasmid-associated DNA primase
VSVFVREVCELGLHYEVGISTLYAEWKQWCDDNGRAYTGYVQMFGRDLHAACSSVSTGKRGNSRNPAAHRIYRGIRLRSWPEIKCANANCKALLYRDDIRSGQDLCWKCRAPRRDDSPGTRPGDGTIY